MIFVCSRVKTIPYNLPGPYQILTPQDYNNYPNIANKESYRHLRQMYLIWKNPSLFDNPQEITIFQERRYLSTSYLPTSYDIVQPTHMHLPSIYDQWRWCSGHPAHKLYFLDKTVELLPRMQEYIHITPAPAAYFHNMGVYTWEIYDQLCSFLFSTLNMLEMKLNINPTEELPVYAMLAERIQNYYIWEHPEYKVFESPLTKV